MAKCIIIDDEPNARDLLEAIIKSYCSELTVAALCVDLPTGIKAIKRHKPDLIFLDIEMPGHSGLELLDFFDEEEVNFSIIFTTAYNEYALQAFKFSAIDYLLKPIQHTELVDAVNRFLKKQQANAPDHLKWIQHNLTNGISWDEKRVIVPTGQTLQFLKPNDIIMIKGEAAYSQFYLKNGSSLLASYNLKHYEDILAPIPFLQRCHKSYIVNTNTILKYVKSDGGFLELQNNNIAQVSANKIDELLAFMAK